MDKIGIRTIVVNFDDEQLPYLSLVQGDAKTRGFDIVICDSDGKEIAPSDDYIVELVATGSNAPDKPYANRHTIKDGKYRVMIPTEALSESGFVFLQLVFYQKSTGAVIHTIEQKCPVYRSRGQEVVESNNLYVDITALRLGLERIDELDGRYESMLGEEKIRQDAEKKRNEQEANRIRDEKTRESNETIRKSQETARKSAEDKRVTAEEERKAKFDGWDKTMQGIIPNVKVDGSTIFINEDGEISVRNPNPDDFSGSPGSKLLIAGTMEEGFFGEVSSSELITGDALASECGISQGTSQHSTAGWLKFAYKGEILFVAKKPIRHSIPWVAINTANCVYGDSGDKTVTIDGLTYKVTLMRALEPSNDPKTTARAKSGEVNHGSEWNRLMCQIHEQALSKSWDYPNNVEIDIGVMEHSLGNGEQGMYNDTDLEVKSGDGKNSWCQEMSTSTSLRMTCGGYGVSYSELQNQENSAHNGWRPVLRHMG